METYKKVIAFVIIFVFLGVSLYLIAGEWLESLLHKDEITNKSIEHILSGEDGATYLLSVVDGVNRVARVDSDGKKLLDRAVPEIADAARFKISQVFCDSEGRMYFGVYMHNDTSSVIEELRVYAFSQDISQGRLIWSTPCDEGLYYDCLYNHRILGISRGEDDDVLILAKNHEEFSIMEYDAEADMLTVTARFTTEGICTTGAVLSKDTAYIGIEGGKLLKFCGEHSVIEDKTYKGVHFARFMPTEDGIVFIEGGTGTLGMIDTETDNVRCVITEPDTADGFRNVSEYRLYHLNGALREAAVTDDNAIYTGSGRNSVMIELDMTAGDEETRDLLIFIGVMLGYLLVALIIWFVYTGVLKGRLSMLIRQSIAMAFIVVLVINGLLEYVMKPSITGMIANEQKDKMTTMASVFAAGVQIDRDDYGVDVEITTDMLVQHGLESEQVGFALYEQVEDGTIHMRASSYNIESGTDIDSPSLGMTMIEPIISAFENDERVGFCVDTDTTLAVSFIRLPDRPNWMAEVFVTHNKLENSLAAIYDSILMQFNIAAVMLLVLLFIINFSTVRGIRRLSRGVELLEKGDMNVMVIQRTGDEVEDLARAFNSMASTLSSTFDRMEAINRSYYRFVPEQLVSLLGEGSIESVGKQSHTRRHMGVMVMWFEFEEGKRPQNTDELFANINEVIEHTSGIVTGNGGMVYDFACDGFNAVFEDDPAKLTATAIAMRHAVLSLNERRAERGAAQVHLYIAMDRGSVMMGMIGDEGRMAPTAISEAINNARALSQQCADIQAYILCTEAVAGACGCDDGMRYIGMLEYGGAARPVYEIFDGDPYSLRTAKRADRDPFHRAVKLFESGQYAEAKLLFMDIVKHDNGDGAARRYLYLSDKNAGREGGAL